MTTPIKDHPIVINGLAALGPVVIMAVSSSLAVSFLMDSESSLVKSKTK